MGTDSGEGESLNADPVEELIAALRPAIERWAPQLEAGTITTIDIKARYEQRSNSVTARHRRPAGWAITTAPQSDEKVIEAWSVDEGRVRAIK